MPRAREVRRPAPDAAPVPDYTRFSTLAGKLREPPERGYRVQFRRLGRRRPLRTMLLVAGALLFVGGFLVWLMLPAHWPHDSDPALQIASIVMVVNTGIIGLSRPDQRGDSVPRVAGRAGSRAGSPRRPARGSHS